MTHYPLRSGLHAGQPLFEHGTSLNLVRSKAYNSGGLTLRYAAEDRDVEPADEFGIGQQVDCDDLPGGDREADHDPRLPVRRPPLRR